MPDCGSAVARRPCTPADRPAVVATCSGVRGWAQPTKRRERAAARWLHRPTGDATALGVNGWAL